MAIWLETAGVVLLACLGIAAGKWFSRQPRPVWILGYAIPLTLVLMMVATRGFSRLEFIPPFSWVMAGRTEFALSALVITLLLITPLTRLPQARDRRAVVALMWLMLCYQSITPFLAPAFNRAFWLSTPTRFDRNHICRQRTDYDCGPAAAVTALGLLGFQAKEGEIAILSHCSASLGTPPDVLSDALQRRYGSQGLICKYRYFHSLEELAGGGPVLAVTRYGMFEDHYLTVLRMDDQGLIVGDPSSGLAHYTRAQFERIWRRTGIQMNRVSPSRMARLPAYSSSVVGVASRPALAVLDPP
jgi:hypothetical protein